jgi:hypothetical protein
MASPPPTQPGGPGGGDAVRIKTGIKSLFAEAKAKLTTTEFETLCEEIRDHLDDDDGSDS